MTITGRIILQRVKNQQKGPEHHKRGFEFRPPRMIQHSFFLSHQTNIDQRKQNSSGVLT